MKVVGLIGSLRKGSYNRMLANACSGLAPQGMTIAIWDRIRDLPWYDADLDTESPPEPVADLRNAIRAADALLVVSPEYNFGIPGALKNAIDWASRPGGGSCLDKKPAAILGAATGPMGSVRMQLALRQTFQFTETYVVPKPEVMVMRAAEKFDAAGNLTDETAKKLITQLLANLVPWAKRMAQP